MYTTDKRGERREGAHCTGQLPSLSAAPPALVCETDLRDFLLGGCAFTAVVADDDEDDEEEGARAFLDRTALAAMGRFSLSSPSSAASIRSFRCAPLVEEDAASLKCCC